MAENDAEPISIPPMVLPCRLLDNTLRVDCGDYPGGTVICESMITEPVVRDNMVNSLLLPI